MLFIWVTLVYIIVCFTDLTGRFLHRQGRHRQRRDGIRRRHRHLLLLYLLLPILMGLILKFTKASEKVVLPIFLILVAVAIWVGKFIPITLPGIDPTNLLASKRPGV